MRSTSALVLALLPLAAYAQTPFPIVFKSGTPAQVSALSSSVSAYYVSATQQAVFTSLANYMATATGLTSEEQAAFQAANNNPFALADEFLGATATPAWYTQIPSNLQSYVSSVANAEASLATQAVSGAGRVETRTVVWGALLATAMVGVLVL